MEPEALPLGKLKGLARRWIRKLEDPNFYEKQLKDVKLNGLFDDFHMGLRRLTWRLAEGGRKLTLEEKLAGIQGVELVNRLTQAQAKFQAAVHSDGPSGVKLDILSDIARELDVVTYQLRAFLIASNGLEDSL